MKERDDPERPRMPKELSDALMEHSPRVRIDRPTLIPQPGSPTGWIVVVPERRLPELHEPRGPGMPTGRDMQGT